MLDLGKIREIGESAASSAAAAVLEYARTHDSIEQVQVSRRVVNFENGVPTGEPYERKLTKTRADQISHEEICRILAAEFPEYPIFSEERYIQYQDTVRDQPYFIVDPIDGTIHLEKGSSQWTINIALCMNGVPLVGIVAVPQENQVYLGLKSEESLFRDLDGSDRLNQIETPVRTREQLIVSKCDPIDLGGEADPVTNLIMQANGLSEFKLSGSAYRYLEIARGAVDLMVHGAGNFLWDKAAAQVVAEGTGGALFELPWEQGSSSDMLRLKIRDLTPLTYQRHPLKDEGHILVSKNCIEQLGELIVPKAVDRRSFWKFVIV